MAIEVSDGFGIVLRAMRLNHQKFDFFNFVTKYSALSKILTNNHKNNLKYLSYPNGIVTNRSVPNAKKAATPESYDLVNL